MQSLRKRKSIVGERLLDQRRRAVDDDARLWDQVPAVGREFGSPDFERLMEEDARNGTGVFDPELKKLFPRRT